jgi:hypothetical protein
MPTDSSPGPFQAVPPDLATQNAEAADFLHRTGLLFEINRAVLHPLGLALGLWQNDDGAFAGFAGLVDHRDDPEGMAYSDETLRSGLERLRAFGVTAIREERARRLGFIVQPLPEEP